MEHPFIHNLNDKSLEDLQNTISELNKKITFAYRTGNRPLINQLTMALESYRTAYTKKMDDLISKQNLNIKIDVNKK
jgi:hypothetical protein